eukprot:356196_1
MSISRGWRSDLDLAKTIIDAKKSRHTTLFQQIDLTRFLDDEYILKLNDRNELFQSARYLSSKSSSTMCKSIIPILHDNITIDIDKDKDKAHHTANEEEISSFWNYYYNLNKTNSNDIITDDISLLSHFLIEQTSGVCEGNIDESIKFKRQLLLQRIILSQTDKKQKLPTSKPRSKSNNSINDKNKSLLDSIESTESFIALPFEAQIGIKLLLSTLDSINFEKDKIFSFKIIKSLLSDLNNFIITLSNKYSSNNDINNKDFGLLNRICDFLISFISFISFNSYNNEKDKIDILAP